MFVDYSAMAGAIGAGGLGTLAIKCDYQRFNTELTLALNERRPPMTPLAVVLVSRLHVDLLRVCSAGC